MRLTKENDRKLYDLFEGKLVEISERVGYGGEELSSEKYRVFEEAWEAYLGGLGVKRVKNYEGGGEWNVRGVWVPVEEEKAGLFLVADPLYTTGHMLEVPEALALKILALGELV